MIAEKFDVRILVDDAPLKEKMSGKETYVVTPFDAKSTFLVKEQLKEPDGTPYYEDWRFTPFTIDIKDNSAVHHDYWMKVHIDGSYASCGHLNGSRVIKGFSEATDSTATSQFCFTPPRRVGGAELGRGSSLSAERLKQLATVRVDIYNTHKLYDKVVDVSARSYTSSFQGVNKEDVKKASKAAAVAQGQDIPRVKYGSGSQTMTVGYWQLPTPQDLVTSCTINYTTTEGFAALGGNDEAEEEAIRNSMNKPRVDGVLVDELVSTFGIPREATSVGIERLKESDLLLAPKCRKPSRMMPSEHTTMSEGKDIMLTPVENSPAAWTSLGNAAGTNVKMFEGRSDSLFMALAHQVTMSEALGPVIRSVLTASLPAGTSLEDMDDFDVLQHFVAAFKCYVAVWPLKDSADQKKTQPIMFKSPPAESNFGTACYMLAMNPSTRGAGRGQWASLISSGQAKEERMAIRRAKRSRDED